MYSNVDKEYTEMTELRQLKSEDYRFIHVRFSKVVYEELKAIAAREERPVSSMVKFIVSKFLNHQS
jgi:hypothetical protein